MPDRYRHLISIVDIATLTMMLFVPSAFAEQARPTVIDSTSMDPTTVDGRLIDVDSGGLMAGRIHLQDHEGRWHFVESRGGTAVRYDRQPVQMPTSSEVHTTISADPFAVNLPPGRYTLRAERGKEFRPLVRTIDVQDQPLEIELPLARWINMAERGWYSGDTHVHRSLDELPNVMLAEDLNVALPLTYWVTTSDTAPAKGDQSDRQRRAGDRLHIDPTHVIHPTNTEYEIFSVGSTRHTLGAVFVLNHNSPLTVGAPPVAPVAQAARQQGALLDLDKHSWPWSMMIVPIMGVDLYELSNNHVWQTAFGFENWTVETIPEFMQIERTPDGKGVTESGWIDFGFKTYYALLNSGFRLRVSAGTASGVHPVQLGFSRVYVYLPDGFSYAAWIEGLYAGRSFVTNGPMMDLRFNGQPAGHTFVTEDNDRPFTLRLHGTVAARRPLDRIEIVINGRVDRSITPGPQRVDSRRYETIVDESITLRSSSWLAVRCFEKHPHGRVRFAHSNPVFIDIAGQLPKPKRVEVEYFVERIRDELQRNHRLLNAESLAEYRQALAIYEGLLRRAE